MKSGLMRHIVNIENKIPNGSDGIGNTRTRWNILYSNVPMQIQPYSAREQWFGEAPQSQTTHRLTMRYLPAIDTTLRITFNGRIFNILGIANLDERNITLTLDCKEDFSSDSPALVESIKTLTGTARFV